MRRPLSAAEKRVVFWTEKQDWPAAPAEYLFLADVVGIVGNAVFGSEWTGLEPATELTSPLPEELLASTPTAELQRGSRLLHQYDEAYRERCPGYAELVDEWPMPTIDEWARAGILAKQLATRRRKEFERFIDVATRLAHAFKNGAIHTATRYVVGGGMLRQDRWFWNTEYYWGRFQMCRVQVVEPFNSTAAIEGDSYIFVDRHSLALAVRQPEEAPAASTLPAAGAEEYLSPYVRCMIAATRGLKVTADDQRKKDEIIADLPNYWQGPDKLTGQDKDRMATFMREPQHKKGRGRSKQ